jgi:methylenetetrahydrofolate reductase (NADPH)
MTERTGADALKLSFEFFPPKSDRMGRRLWRAIGQLELLNPNFFSVTYGALGSARDSSIEAVMQVHKESPVPTAAHLTCVDSTKEDLNGVIRQFRDAGVRRFVALRGDPREDGAGPQGYADAAELVEGLLQIDDFDISVAAYPEVHPKAASRAADIAFLKHKLDAGAQRALTQYFFDAEMFLRFRDDCVAAGIDKPIVPGILPVHDYQQVANFSARCGASVPSEYAALFDKVAGDREATYHLGIDLAVETCEKLIAEGVDALHFYTLNHTDLCFAVCRALGRSVAERPVILPAA